MIAHHDRKLLLAAMLATALSAPTLANDVAITAQQTMVGQDIAQTSPNDPVVADESYSTVTNGPMTLPTMSNARATVVKQLPVASAGRPPRSPLILGIRH